MSKPTLVPYAGAEQARLREPRGSNRRATLLASIFRRQKQGMLLSEIGDALGSRSMVRAVVLVWLFGAAA